MGKTELLLVAGLFTNMLAFGQGGGLSNFDSNLPLVSIETYGADIVDEPKIRAHMGIINNANGINNISDPFNEYDGIIGIEIRGSSSSLFEKKSYGIETRNDDNSNNNVPLLGLPKENDWVLYGPYSDKSLIRNALAYTLGNDLGKWNPHVRYTELYINGEYSGVYVLIEKIKRDKHRLDITKMNPMQISGDSLTGGYLLSVDRSSYLYWISPYPGKTGLNIYINCLYPEYTSIAPEQFAYIKEYITSFEGALLSEDYSDPIKGYRPYVDVNSFAKYFLVNELSRNIDAYRLSTFMYKDRNARLEMGPLWDYDLAFGNADYYEGYNPEGWVIYDDYLQGDDIDVPVWWERLRTDLYFNLAVKTQWNLLRKGPFAKDHIFGIIDSLSTLVSSAEKRNFEKFQILGSYVWPNYFVAETYEQEINYLKNWISDRIDWLDSEIALITSVGEIEGINAFETFAFPNPSADQVTIRMMVERPVKIDLVITDLLGHVIYEQEKLCPEGKNDFTVPGTEFGARSGIFVYQLRVNNKSIFSGKLIRK